MKICIYCLIEKPFSEFHKRKDSKDGRTNKCKSCHKEHGTKYYSKNKDAINVKNREYAIVNKEKIRAYNKQYREENKEHLSEVSRRWKQANREKVREQSRRQKSKNLKLRRARTNIYNGLKRGYSTETEAYKLLGADYDTVWNHLKKTWLRRYGKELKEGDKYELDHIIPCSFREDHHYSNLQLLTPTDNRVKFNKMTNLET